MQFKLAVVLKVSLAFQLMNEISELSIKPYKTAAPLFLAGPRRITSNFVI